MSSAIRWTPAMLDAYKARVEQRSIAPAPAAPARSKYGGEKVQQDGLKFDSKKEARRWLVLEQLQRAGQITELKRQVAFELAPSVRLSGEPRAKPALRYFADATYLEDGQLVVEDVKSPATRKKEAYRIKKHLLKTVHGLDIREI